MGVVGLEGVLEVGGLEDLQSISENAPWLELEI